MWPILDLTLAFWSKFVRGGRIQAQNGSKAAREPPIFLIFGVIKTMIFLIKVFFKYVRGVSHPLQKKGYLQG